MGLRKLVLVALGVVLSIATSDGCGGKKSVPPNPLPKLASITPVNATAGDAGFSLVVKGTDFSGNSVVNWNGNLRTTAFVNATELTATISATDLAAPGTVQVTVTTPAPGGGTSQPAVFRINQANNPVPTVSSIAPTSAMAGGSAFTLTVNGTNLLSTSVVQWNGAALATTFTSSTQVTAQIPASNIATAGTANVTVSNPAPGGGTSASVSFAITAPAKTIGIVQLLSGAINGAPGNGESLDPAISSDGTYVAFDSTSSDLVPNDGNGSTHDEYLRTTCLQPGAPQPCTPATEIVSLTSSGNQLPNGATSAETGAYMSSDGRFIVFEGRIGDVIANPPVGPATSEVFLRDTCKGQPAGCSPTTTVVSLTDSGAPVDSANNGAISANGRVVVFFSAANVVTGVTGGTELYARDTCFGAPVSPACTPSTFLISMNDAGVKGNSTSQTGGPSLSSDGRYVAFYSDSTNLVPGDTNNRLDVFLRDTCTGAGSGCTPHTVLISANPAGAAGIGGSNGSFVPSLTGDARFVMFQSDATDLVSTSNNGVFQIYLRDTCIGAAMTCTPTTTLVTADSTGRALTGPSTLFGQGNVSATGRYLLFGPGSPLNPGDTIGQAYVRDTCFGAPAGCIPKTNLISVDSRGNQFAGGVRPMAISADGRFAVLFDGVSQLYLALTGF